MNRHSQRLSRCQQTLLIGENDAKRSEMSEIVACRLPVTLLSKQDPTCEVETAFMQRSNGSRRPSDTQVGGIGCGVHRLSVCCAMRYS